MIDIVLLGLIAVAFAGAMLYVRICDNVTEHPGRGR